MGLHLSLMKTFLMRELLRSIFRFKHIAVTLVASFLMLLVVFGLLFSISFLNPVERAYENFRMTDLFYDADNYGGERDTSGVITLVDMTDVFSRSRLAEIVEGIDALEPSILGVDIVFDGLRDDSVGNERLIEAVCNTKSQTIWAYKLTEWSDDVEEFTKTYHSFFTEYVEVEEGYTNVQRDINGGTVRTFGLQRKAEGRIEYSLPARVAMGATNDSSFLRFTDCNIRYSSIQFPVVPCDSIADYADFIRGHIVLLGATDDKRDLHYTPMGHIAGLKILAYTVQTIISNQIPIETSLWATILLTVLLIWLGELFQHGVTYFLSKRKNWFLQELARKDLVSGLIFIIYIIILVWADFLFFIKTNHYFNMGWAIMGIALLETSHKWCPLLHRIYLESIDFIKSKLHKK